MTLKIQIALIFILSSLFCFATPAQKEGVVKNMSVVVANTSYKIVHQLEHQPFIETVRIEKKCKNSEPSNFFYKNFCKVKSLTHDKQKNQITIKFHKIDRKSPDNQCKKEFITLVVNLTDECK